MEKIGYQRGAEKKEEGQTPNFPTAPPAPTVIVAGLVGQIAGYTVLKNTVGMPSSVGMSLGTASHAMGIAASLERSRRMAAYAGLGLTLNGVLTAAIAPIIIPVLGF